MARGQSAVRLVYSLAAFLHASQLIERVQPGKMIVLKNSRNYLCCTLTVNNLCALQVHHIVVHLALIHRLHNTALPCATLCFTALQDMHSTVLHCAAVYYNAM